MNCIEPGTLRAKLDGELRGPELELVERHLTLCPACRREMDEMSARSLGVGRALEDLAPRPGEAESDPLAAWALLRARAAAEGADAQDGYTRPWVRRWAPAWGAALALCALAAAMAFAPARSWAQRVLARLRVQKIEAVAMSPVLPGPGAEDRTAKMVQQLISDNLVVTEDPGKPQEVASLAEAASLAGFPVRGLSGRPEAPHIEVNGEQAFHFTLNRDRLQAIVDEAGRSDVQLPAAIDGAEVAVHIPKAVILSYGNLPGKAAPGAEGQAGQAGPPARYAGPGSFVAFAQVPTPTVSVPPNLNLAQVAEAGLELGGMAPAAAHSFVGNVDWTSTLVIPVPVEGASTQKIPVDGVEGTLITAPAEGKRPAGYTLIWIKNGIIYSLAGSGDAGNAVALGDSLN